MNDSASGANAIIQRASVTGQQLDEIPMGRTFVTRIVMWTFVGTIIFIGFSLGARGFGFTQWDGVTTQALDLVKSTVLPVVTLVLGYYFGREGPT